MRDVAGVRPSELVITLAAVPTRFDGPASRDGWVYADEVRGRLKLLGFDPSTQQVAAWLNRMAKVDAPWVEHRNDDPAPAQYRVTQFGRTDVDNRLPGVRLYTPWLPTWRAFA